MDTTCSALAASAKSEIVRPSIDAGSALKAISVARLTTR
jgi:hypothetical protein